MSTLVDIDQIGQLANRIREEYKVVTNEQVDEILNKYFGEDGSPPEDGVFGQLKDYLQSQIINPNLVQNWNWTNPRKLTEMFATEVNASNTNTRFLCGAWIAYSGILTYHDDYISFTSDKTNAYKLLRAFLSGPVKAGTYTLSILARIPENSGSLYLRPEYNSTHITQDDATLSKKIDSTSDDFTLYSYTFTLNNDLAGKFSVSVITLNNVNDYFSIDIKAWKLEVGDRQTLAKQNENGEWVIIDNEDISHMARLVYPIPVNQNLLVNSRFFNPINQLGQTEYTGASTQCIDYWRTIANGNAMTTVTVDSVNREIIIHPTPEGYGQSGIIQHVEFTPAVSTELTFSALYKGDIRIGANGTTSGYDILRHSDDWDIATFTYTVPAGTSMTSKYMPVICVLDGDGECHLRAAKLEIGATQTLATRNWTGESWNLTEPPFDYNVELLKCQRRQRVWHRDNTTYGLRIGYGNRGKDGNWVTFQFPFKMSKTPASIDISKIRLFNIETSEYLDPSKIKSSSWNVFDTTLELVISVTADVPIGIYSLSAKPNEYFIIDANY